MLLFVFRDVEVNVDLIKALLCWKFAVFTSPCCVRFRFLTMRSFRVSLICLQFQLGFNAF